MISYFIVAVMSLSCSPDKQAGDDFDITKSNPPTKVQRDKASTRIDLENKGVGEITSVELPEPINQEMAVAGQLVYNQKCTACHKVGERFIGPAPDGILERRSPEWIMNMILSPELMIKEDPLAKDLFMEFNGAPMANQNLTVEEARSILEYFRTL